MNEDRATRYHRLKRQLGVLGWVWTLLLLGGLTWTGWTVTLRDAAESTAATVATTTSVPGLPALTVVVYVVLLSLLNEMGSLPLGWYSGHVVERRYGLSHESLAHWAIDEVKSLGIGMLLGCCGATLLYFLIRLSPDWWWMSAGLLFTLIIVGLTNLAPILVLPLFYTVKPLGREALRVRLLSLADRAGARVLGAYEWGLSAKTTKANAALAGIGGTRRILVSDTMLAEYSDEEIEVVLAHELAHHVHGDIWKGIVFESALMLAGFYLAARTLAGLSDRVGLRDVADPAGLPLLLLAAGAVSFLMMPVAHAVSRAYERSADRFALDLTKNPGAFISAMRRLGAQNLAEEHPSQIVQWLFYSHPPVTERIAAARAFSPR
jgi:Zn-dependent protease with chaperone function